MKWCFYDEVKGQEHNEEKEKWEIAFEAAKYGFSLFFRTKRSLIFLVSCLLNTSQIFLWNQELPPSQRSTLPTSYYSITESVLPYDQHMLVSNYHSKSKYWRNIYLNILPIQSTNVLVWLQFKHLFFYHSYTSVKLWDGGISNFRDISGLSMFIILRILYSYERPLP